MQDELRRAIDTIPGLVWSARPDGSVDFVNQRWCDYTGVSLDDARGGGWERAVAPDDRPRLLADWQAWLASGEPGETEARLRRFDGALRWFLIRAVPLHGDGGKVVKWYAQNTDIDDRKRAEALLAGEKRLLEMAASACALGDVLEALCSLFETEAGGAHCSVLLYDDAGATLRHGAAPTLAPGFRQTIDGKSARPPYWGPCAMAADEKRQVIVPDIERDPRWRDGAWSGMSLAAGLRSCWTTPIVSRAGDVLGTFAIYQREPASPTRLQRELIERLTHVASIAIERARTAAALQESEQRLRVTADFLAQAQRLSGTGAFSWRAADDAIVWSQQTYRIYGIDPGAAVTFELVMPRIHPEDVAWFRDRVRRAKAEGRDLEIEHRLLVDGSVKHVHVVAHATRDAAGGLEYVGAVQDVTERYRAEDTLSRLRSELAHMARVSTLGALTASIAHEVNQPLAGIVTNASTSLRMLADDPPDVDGARETARRTIRDANRASDVIARLRALFRKSNAASDGLDLNEAARDVIALSLRELQKAHVVLHTELADDVPRVIGDRVQLQQVMLNLVLNAAEAMTSVDDRARQLLIRTERDADDHVRLTVRDTGPGIDAQHANRLFDPFYTTKRDGMGVGLSISRSIVESHYGRLWAAAHDGPGATFAFSIPRVPPGSAARPPEGADSPEGHDVALAGPWGPDSGPPGADSSWASSPGSARSESFG